MVSNEYNKWIETKEKQKISRITAKWITIDDWNGINRKNKSSAIYTAYTHTSIEWNEYAFEDTFEMLLLCIRMCYSSDLSKLLFEYYDIKSLYQ